SLLTLGVRILGRGCAFLKTLYDPRSSSWVNKKQRGFTGLPSCLVALVLPLLASTAFASERDLILPDLSTTEFFGMTGHSLLMLGLLVCVGGMLFGLRIYKQLENMPVHRSMREISDLIYETCKTYLLTQGKFILVLWVLIGSIMVVYFG